MTGAIQKGACLLWAGAIFSSAYAFTSRPQIYSQYNSFCAFARSHTLFAYRWMDYIIWFSCRGFHLFSFAVLSLLMINTCKLFRTWQTLVFIPLILFAFFEDSYRIRIMLQMNPDSLLLMDVIGIVIGIFIFARIEIKRAQIHMTKV